MVRFMVGRLKKLPDFRDFFGIFTELSILRNPPAVLPGTEFIKNYAKYKQDSTLERMGMKR